MGTIERLRRPAPFPWGRPRAELLILALIGAVALSPVFTPDAQDTSRICLARALVTGRLSNDACFPATIDHSAYHGHLYSDKAPGMSVLELAPAEAVGLPNPTTWSHAADVRLWFVHVFASGIPFLLCLLLVGRISEGLAPGLGAPALVAFGLGTLMSPLAASCFEHVATALLGFLAFVLAWRRRSLAAGLAAGGALVTEYEAAAVLLIVLAYTALQGRRAAIRYLAGAAPGVILLGAYDWLAFGAPWRAAYRYLANTYAAEQRTGLLGIHLPTLAATRLVFVGQRGLLVVSPILVAAAYGLVLLWRRGLRAEALTCAAVAAAFTIAECGYFLPYGGVSPGPRFLTPCLPFLALGLAPAFARRPVMTWLLAVASVIATTAVSLTWSLVSNYHDTIWGEIGRAFSHRGASLDSKVLNESILTWGAPTVVGALVVVLLAAAAFAVGIGLPHAHRAALPGLDEGSL